MKTTNSFKYLIFTIFFVLTITACASSPKPTDKSSAVFTAAAETVSVQLTQSAEKIKTTPTPTSPPTSTSTIAIALASPSPVASGTVKPSATNPPISSTCDQLDFITDITTPDGTVLNPGTTFIKTWKLLNSGTCAWKTTYSLVFFGGDRLGGAQSVKLPQEVAPGTIIELSIELKAPDKAGSYTSYFKLENQNGERFGIKPNNSAFWVKINVGTSTSTPTSTTPTVPAVTSTPGITPSLAITTAVPTSSTPAVSLTPTPSNTPKP
jgi:hypothetical protein